MMENLFNIGINHFIAVSALLFVIATFGMFANRRNVIVVLMSIELMLLAVQINFVAFSVQLRDISGQIFSIFVLTVAAAEAAIGLAVLITFFRNRDSIDMEDISELKG